MESNQWKGYKALSIKWKLLIPTSLLLATSFIAITIFSNLNPDANVLVTIVGICILLLDLLFIYIIMSNIMKPINNLNESLKKIANGEPDIVIEVSSGDEIGQLASSMLNVKNNIDLLADIFSDISNDIQVGNLFSRIDENRLSGKYQKVLKNVNSIISNLVDYLDELTLSVVIVDTDYKIRFMNKFVLDIMGNPPVPPIGMRCHEIFKTKLCKTQNCVLCECMKTGRSASADNVAEMGEGFNFYIQNMGIPIRDSKGTIVGALELTYNMNDIFYAQKKAEKTLDYQKQEVERLIGKMNMLANGNLNIQPDVGEGDEDTKIAHDNFKELNQSLHSSASTIKRYIDEINYVLNEMSAQNMDVMISGEFVGDFSTIKDSINNISKNMNNVLLDIQSASNNVQSSSSDVANTNESLTAGLNEQVNSVSTINETVSKVSDQIKRNSENSIKASELSNTAKSVAENGSKQMNEMVLAMEDIKKSSDEIAKIIKVVDDIASQTNLLALNAAVEAARSGQYGKGFAVVASEVRSLAARSATAAKETTEMIDSSLRKVAVGSSLAHETSEMLNNIVSSVTDTSKIVEKISQASAIQGTEIIRLEESVKDIFNVAQTNLSLLEQNSSTSEEMENQALALQGLVSQFQLHKNKFKK